MDSVNQYSGLDYINYLILIFVVYFRYVDERDTKIESINPNCHGSSKI